jgi:hypothetical protein
MNVVNRRIFFQERHLLSDEFQNVEQARCDIYLYPDWQNWPSGYQVISPSLFLHPGFAFVAHLIVFKTPHNK